MLLFILADIPLSSSNPLNLMLPRSGSHEYQPIVESADNSSVDSYTMALEGEGR